MMRNGLNGAETKQSLAPAQPVPVLSRETWSAFLLPYGTAPLAKEKRGEWKRYFEAVIQALRADGKVQPGVWLQVQAFPRDETAQLVAQHGREWRPMMGLGIWPDREPPRTWTAADFTERDWGTPLPTLMDSLLELSGERNAALDGWATLFGTGCTLLMLLGVETASFYAKTRDRLSGAITDPALRYKTFYAPLLSAASISSLRDELSTILPDVRLYLRESKEDDATVMIVQTRDVPTLVKARLLPGSADNEALRSTSL